MNPITQCLQRAVDQGVFPGAVLRVRVKGEIRYHAAVGRLGFPPYDQPVQVDTIYDLASLTKPLATATAVLCLIQDSMLRLEQSIGECVTELQGLPLGAVTIRQLLSHQGGLPAWRPYYESWASEDSGSLSIPERKYQVIQRLADEPLVYPPGTRSIYSDPGFLLLGMAVERCSQMSLPRYCRERIFQHVAADPLFFRETSGNPSLTASPISAPIAPTERDRWRGRIVCGEVHDENAYALGGMAGHAGLFGTAEAVGTMSRMWLDAVRGRQSLLSMELAQTFTKRQDVAGSSSWGLGWDTPSPPSSSGQWFSQESFGHLGFTGTSIWIDPIHELEVILLSNRIHPERTNTTIKQFRPELHTLVFHECIGCP